ncbi:MAG: hypothetical protein ACREJU_13835 [Nitrospiraceae bacterium]
MRQLLTLIVSIAAGVALLTPLIYAIATLRGMQHKKVYPLLRYRERIGPLTVPQT